MELNAKQVKKALECCTGYDDCNIAKEMMEGK